MMMEKLPIFNRHKIKRTKLQNRKNRLLSIAHKVLPIHQLGSSMVLELAKGTSQRKVRKKKRKHVKLIGNPIF